VQSSKDFVDSVTRAWIVLGDFNAVLRVEDRIEGNKVIIHEILDFREC